MYAAVIANFADPPTFAEFGEPEAQAGEVVAEVRAAAVSNIVRAIAAGAHYSSAAKPPMIAGLDGVVQLPDGSLAYVPAVRPPWGTLAERAAVPVAATVPVPPGLEPVQAAAVVNAARASWLPLTRILAPGATPTVLVLGATGASGSAAVSIARHLGARRVIAVGREGDALRRATRRGATDVVPLDDDLEANVARLGAEGVDIVVDFLWGDAGAQVMRTLARTAPSPRHRIDWINSGAMDGAAFSFDAALLRMSDLHVWGSGAGAYAPERMREMAVTALDLAARGVVTVDVEQRRLADVGETWNDGGRLVFVP